MPWLCSSQLFINHSWPNCWYLEQTHYPTLLNYLAGVWNSIISTACSVFALARFLWASCSNIRIRRRSVLAAQARKRYMRSTLDLTSNKEMEAISSSDLKLALSLSIISLGFEALPERRRSSWPSYSVLVREYSAVNSEFRLGCVNRVLSRRYFNTRWPQI